MYLFGSHYVPGDLLGDWVPMRISSVVASLGSLAGETDEQTVKLTLDRCSGGNMWGPWLTRLGVAWAKAGIRDMEVYLGFSMAH